MSLPSGRRAASALAPELRVLLASVRGDPNALAGAFEPIRAGKQDRPDWAGVVALASREGATPYLRALLDRIDHVPSSPGEPEAAREALGTLARLALVHEFRLRELDRRLTALLPAFRDRGIDVVLLKGAALRRTVHARVIDRPMSDVDVLVERGEAERAWDIARELGWERRAGLPPEEAYRDHHHLAPMTDPAGLGLGLEIHTEVLATPHPFDFTASLVRRDARPVEGLPGVRVPSPTHALVHASIHFAWGHTLGFGTWKTLRDVHALTAAGRIDGDELLRVANATRAGACVYWTLRLARDWAGVSVVPGTLRALAPPGSETLHRALSRHFGRRLASRDSEGVPAALSRSLWSLAMRPSSQGWGTTRPWAGAEKWIRPGHGADAGLRPNAAVRMMEAARYLSRLVVD